MSMLGFPRHQIAGVLVVLLALAGCDTSGYDTPPAATNNSAPTPPAVAAADSDPSPAAPPAEEEPTPSREPDTPEPLPLVDEAPLAGPANSSPALRSTTGAEPALEVQLLPRTAVALPQTLPTGTSVGFSVDYLVRGGTPLPDHRYVWVIQSANGQSVASEIQLGQEGTLQSFVPQFRPEHAPFSCFVGEISEQGEQRQISKKIDFP